MPKIINNDGVTKVGVGKDKDKKKKLSNVPKSIQPSFFHKNLTGKGGTSKGLLNETVDPKMHPNGYANLPRNMDFNKITNGNIKIYNIPLYIIPPNCWSIINNFEKLDDAILIAKKNGIDVHLSAPIHAIQLEEEKDMLTVSSLSSATTSSIRKSIAISFHPFLFFTTDPNKTMYRHADMRTSGDYALVTNSMVNMFSELYTNNLVEYLKMLINDLTTAGYDVDKAALNDFLQNYSIYVETCKAAERWNNKIDYYLIDVLAENIKAYNIGRGDPTSTAYWHGYGIDTLEHAISRLDKYNNIPLEKFHSMYTKLTALAPTQDILAKICKAHLNLLLSDTLHTMDTNKSSLKYCPNNDMSVANSTIDGHTYSVEQKNAISSVSPLTLVQSGAGTGKSTIILARIEHMIANGIDPEKILVLSFTNAAADHILEKNPNVKSMTIDAMMRQIYSHNYPSHALSSISTIINSLGIYFDSNVTPMTNKQKDFISEFKDKLQRLRDRKDYIGMMNFVEENIDDVVDTLNVIEQTSLELQGIICYMKMNTFQTPINFDIEHMIIDEVQDNSIFQFIYAIEYTNKNKCSLYIVGDCSQTLYEFRASNPKALNLLEGSGVFATYKLQTNYRSNQEILDFANIALSNIEANQYAKIQLKANDMTPTTLKKFKSAVNLCYKTINNKSKDTINALCADAIVASREYILDKINKGEQIAILAYKRDILKTLFDNDYDRNTRKHLLKLFPTVPKYNKDTGTIECDANGNPLTEDTRIVSIVSNKQYDSTIFSMFIYKHWNLIKYAPPTNILTTITRELYANINNMASHNKQAFTISAKRLIDKFSQEYSGRINELQKEVAMSTITTDEMLNTIKKWMISFEIKENGCNQASMSAKNAQNKTNENIKNAHFILSTIHGAKGLEFDNVILFYDGSSDDKMDEADKRMYYVALTRAKKSEFIFAYDRITAPRSKISKDYDRLTAMLAEKDKAAANANTPMSSTNVPVGAASNPITSTDNSDD